MERKDELTILGKNTVYKQDYAPEVLEAFVNKHPENDYWVRFNCPEFTSLCPITGQPDFAEIRISYLPDVKMVESKSLKLYLFSFRNHGDFHEDCVNIIMKDLIKLMDPKYIEVTGIFTPRGGISIYPYCNYGRPGTKYEKLADMRWLQRVALWTIPLASMGSQAGWVVAEVGRQPWAIQDMLPVGAAISKLQTGSVQLTFFIFLLLFTVLLFAEIGIMLKAIKKGPEGIKN